MEKSDAGYWVGHFQIFRKWKGRSKEDADETGVETKAMAPPEDSYTAKLIQSALPVPESFLKQKVCCVAAEMIKQSIPNR